MRLEILIKNPPDCKVHHRLAHHPKHPRHLRDRWGVVRLGVGAKDSFELLVTNKDISASEAASSFNLHIQTAPDLLEAMTSLGILSKVEVHEKKRPYFRCALEKECIRLEIDLAKLQREKPEGVPTMQI